MIVIYYELFKSVTAVCDTFLPEESGLRYKITTISDIISGIISNIISDINAYVRPSVARSMSLVDFDFDFYHFK